MSAAPPTTRPTDAPDQPHPGEPTGPRRRTWPVLPLAVVGWFLGLTPWFVARRSVGTFGTPWNPRNDMREALLPFHHNRLTLLLSVVLLGGAVAGLAAWWVRPQRGRRLAAAGLVILGTAWAVGFSVWQTLSLHPDLGGTGNTTLSPEKGLALLTFAGAATGLLLGLLASLGAPALRAMAAAPLAVIAANGVGALVISSSSDPSPALSHPHLPTVLWVLTGLLAGVGLAFGPRPVPAHRAVLVVATWLVAFALLWVTQSAFTAARYFLEGARGVATSGAELRALGHDSLRLLTDTLDPGFAPWRAALLAAIVGGAGLALRQVVGSGEKTAQADPVRVAGADTTPD